MESPNQSPNTNSRAKLNNSSAKATSVHRTESRITKLELAMILAVWAEHKPDSIRQRTKLKELDKQKSKFEFIRDKKMPIVETGATLMDSAQMIISVAGSGYTHAAAYLCSLFPNQAKGGVMCVTKLPCSHCLKMMTQAGLGRIIVLTPAKDAPPAKESEIELNEVKPDDPRADSKVNKEQAKIDEDFCEPEPSVSGEWKKLEDDDFKKLLLSSTTGYSTFHFHSSDVPKTISEKLLAEIEKDNNLTNWHLGLAILASLRSEDPTLKVGAVLAKIVQEKDGERSVIHAVGYNGFRQQALPFDYNASNKAPFSLHAEQNLLLFRGAHEISECTLFTTHSPCYQCSCLILQHFVPMVYYVDLYRAPCLIQDATHSQFGLNVIRSINPNFAQNHSALPSKDNDQNSNTFIDHILKAYNENQKDSSALSQDGSHTQSDLFAKLIEYLISVDNVNWDRIMEHLQTLVSNCKPDVVLRLAGDARSTAQQKSNSEATKALDEFIKQH